MQKILGAAGLLALVLLAACATPEEQETTRLQRETNAAYTDALAKLSDSDANSLRTIHEQWLKFIVDFCGQPDHSAGDPDCLRYETKRYLTALASPRERTITIHDARGDCQVYDDDLAPSVPPKKQHAGPPFYGGTVEGGGLSAPHAIGVVAVDDKWFSLRRLLISLTSREKATLDDDLLAKQGWVGRYAYADQLVSTGDQRPDTLRFLNGFFMAKRDAILLPSSVAVLELVHDKLTLVCNVTAPLLSKVF